MKSCFLLERLNESNEMYVNFERISGVPMVEALQYSKSKKVYEDAAYIIREFGNGEEMQARIQHGQ